MSKLAGMLQIIGAGAAGYMQGKRIEERDAEAKADRLADRAFQEENRGRQRQEWERQDQVRSTIKDGQSDVAIEEIPGQSDYNIESMGGVGVPQGAPKPTPAGYKVAGQTFADRAAAEQAALGLNTKMGRAKRTAEGLNALGEAEQAAKYEAHMKQLVAEGTVEALDSIAARAPAPADVKKAGGKVASTIGQELADRFNSTGKWKVSPDTVVEYFTTKNAAGQEIVNARVIGKDGKPVLDDVQGAYRTMLSVKERMAAENDDSRTYLSAQQQAEQARHNGVAERLDEKRTNASIADAAAQRGIQQQRLAMEKQSFKKQGLSGQIADIEEATGVKLTADEKKVLAGIKPGKGGKEADALSAKIVEASVKTFQENTPNVTTGQIATFRANLERDMAAARGNLQVESEVRNVFAKLKPGTPEYAEAYSDAQTEAGMTAQKLAELGIKPPATPSAAQKAASTGTRPASAPAPAARTPHPQSAPVNAGAYDRNRNAFDERPADNSGQVAQQRAQLQGEVARLQALVASGEGTPQFRAQQAARLALYQRQLAALPQ